MGEALEVAKVLVEPTIKLLDMIGGAIGTVYEPRHKRKMADATVYEINVVGESLRNNSDIIITYDKGTVTASSPEFEEFVKRTQHRLAYQELLKQHNIEAIIDNAYGELSGIAAVSNRPVDKDWVSSFFNFVENISSEQMQVLWGRLLAGEVKCPGSFSIRTLDVLRKMTQYEANLFYKIAPYVLSCPGNKERTITDYFIISEFVDDSFENDVMRFSNIQLLTEVGLFMADSLVTINIKIQPGTRETIKGMNRKIEILNTGEECAEISRHAFLLTQAGKELLSIILATNAENNNTEYFEKCAKLLTSNDEFSIIDKCTGQVEYSIIE